MTISGESVEPNEKTYRAHVALACLYGVVVLALVAISAASGKGDDTSPGAILALVMMVPTVIHFMIARGAQRRAGWARICSMILGILMLPGFPIGTIVGIYLLVNAVQDWTPRRKYSGSLTEGWPDGQGGGT